jgi:two-component system response regulator RegX3
VSAGWRIDEATGVSCSAGDAGNAAPVSATPPVRVLLVEDEEAFIDALGIGLAREGFAIEVARDGGEALALFDQVQPDLVLPTFSGLDVCRELRRRSEVPIIMVTARAGEIDTVVGLEVGADDYVAKPYRLRELVARMRAVLRRRGGTAEGAAAGTAAGEMGDSEVLVAGDIELDVERHEVRVRGDQVRLPLKEFELLALLMENAGRVLPRAVLIDRVWGHDYVGDTKTLDVHIKRIRAKIEADPSHPSRIVTIRGLGYKFAT